MLVHALLMSVRNLLERKTLGAVQRGQYIEGSTERGGALDEQLAEPRAILRRGTWVISQPNCCGVHLCCGVHPVPLA
jgi:hypothetical protein